MIAMNEVTTEEVMARTGGKAGDGEGITEILETLEAHWSFLTRSGELERRRARGMEASTVASKKKDFADRNTPEDVATCTDLEPIGYVERELVSPDGKTVKVKVPVYPPFELASETAAKTEP